MRNRPWPGPLVVALISCREGDPHFTAKPDAKRETCYCCGETIMVNVELEREKQDRGDQAEFLCTACWAEKRSPDAQLFQNGQRIA